MTKIAIALDSNSGVTQKEAAQLGLHVLPMPFMIEDHVYYEERDLSQEEFYRYMEEEKRITTSQPTPEDVTGFWDGLLKNYDEIVYIPMSSSLSGSCQTAQLLAQDYDGRVEVVNNQRISVTQKQSALDAYYLAAQTNKSAAQIKEFLEADKLNSSIYVMLNTLTYLKRGGRITPAAAALGNILRLKPVLQIQGGKLDAFAKARTVSQGKSIMINAVKNDIAERFGKEAEGVSIAVAHSHNAAGAVDFQAELQKEFPTHEIEIQELPLSIGCHIGPGALAVTCTKNICRVS